MSPQDLDHIGMQAAHEGELEVLRKQLAEMAHFMLEADEDRRSIERLYARAIDAQVTLEKTLDHVRAESARQTEEIRALRQTVGAFYR